MLELAMHHLAGKLGVEIAEKLLHRKFIILEEGEYIVTEQGKKWFLNFGINIEKANIKRRIFAKPCLDWSERRYHISGWLGSAIAKLFLNRNGLQRRIRIGLSILQEKV